MKNPVKWTWGTLTGLALSMSAGVEAQTYERRPANASEPPIFLDQNWSEEERQYFYHASQGTQFMRYSWFMALEEPGNERSFRSDEELKEIGFLSNKYASHALNPDDLPIGFAKSRDPETGEDWVGLTCAGCHTGEIHYQGERIRIDGGPGMVNTGNLITQLFEATAATRLSSAKFDRFAKRVLGDEDTDETRKALKHQLTKFLTGGLKSALDSKVRDIKASIMGSLGWGKKHVHHTKAGYGRLDALGTGGNVVFAATEGANYEVANAPVSLPHLWGTTDFLWVEYNSAIQQPLARNVAEALGVGAPINLDGPPEKLFESGVRIDNLHRIENLLGELEPPRWPEEILGEIDTEKAARGEELYDDLCASCHTGTWTEPNKTWGRSFLELTKVPLADIGTDPMVIDNLLDRRVHLPPRIKTALGVEADYLSVPEVLQAVTTEVIDRKLDELEVPDSERPAWEGYRPNEWRGTRAYRARPLEGIWSTAPFLHNGSVPNLYDLLSPVDERPTTFWVGSHEFDPVRVGFDTSGGPHRSKFDISEDGNSNKGHEFRDAPLGTSGVVGPALSEQQRWDLIEYMKTL